MKCLLCNKPVPLRLTISDILWPGVINRCPLCSACASTFVHYDNKGQRCPGCYKDSDGGLCVECQQWQEQYGWHLTHQALYRYNDAMKEFMHQYKFAGDYRLRQVFQAEFSARVKSYQADLIVPIPVTLETMQTRGFNQVTGLLHKVAYQELLVAKKKSKQAQSTKTRKERLATPQPFNLVSKLDIRGKNVLLVDDVYTTGRTLYHAATLFKQAGANKIGSVSLAR